MFGGTSIRIGLGDASSVTDQLLNPVVNALGANDPSELSGTTKALYDKAHSEIAGFLRGPNGPMHPEAALASVAPKIMSLVQAIASGASQPVITADLIQAIDVGLIAAATAIGGPLIGLVVGGALSALIGAVGIAQGGAGQCDRSEVCSDTYYGAYNLTQLQNRGAGAQDWGVGYYQINRSDQFDWTNQTPQGPVIAYSDGTWMCCSNDIPTVRGVWNYPPNNVNPAVTNQVNNPEANPVTTVPQCCFSITDTNPPTPCIDGMYWWLPCIMYGYDLPNYTTTRNNPAQNQATADASNGLSIYFKPGTSTSPGPYSVYFDADGPDAMFANLFVRTLQAYINARGVLWDEPTIYDLVRGWNAIHQPGNPISLNGGCGSSVNTDDQMMLLKPLPGDIVCRLLTVSSSAPLSINTGPLIQSLQDLINAASSPGSLIPSGYTPPALHPLPRLSIGGGLTPAQLMGLATPAPAAPKGMSTGAKWLIGLGIAGGIGALALEAYAHSHGMTFKQGAQHLWSDVKSRFHRTPRMRPATRTLRRR